MIFRECRYRVNYTVCTGKNEKDAKGNRKVTDYIVDLIRIMLAGIPVYVLARGLLLLRRARRLGAKCGKKKVKLEYNKLRELCLGLFVLFMMALMTFVLQGEYTAPKQMMMLAKMRINTGAGMNFVPFHTIRNYYRVFGWRGDLFGINIIGNILMFVPWGYGLMLLWKKKRNIGSALLYTAFLPIMIEFFQLFINRQVDVDDFILNFLGGMLGSLVFWIFGKMFPKAKDFAI